MTPRAHQHVRARRAAGIASIALILVSLSTSAIAAEASPASGGSADDIGFELLQPIVADAEEYALAGVGRVTLELGWDAYEPMPGVFNETYLEHKFAEARTYQAAGIDVVLDLGLQYPPSWVWELPGSTRFVNQFGDSWVGGIGTNPLNAVWNARARDAEARAIRAVARFAVGTPFVAVRVGGLLSGEIRFPPSTYMGEVGCLWGFDASAQRSSPVRTYVPGSGSHAQARLWLSWYLQSLTNYEVWLARTVNSAFPAADLDVLLPGWGLRPGEAETAVNGLLSSSAVAASGDNVSSAVDWAGQVKALKATGLPVVLTTTWIDAPSYGTAPRDLAPVEYLVGLAAPRGLRVSGENTGGGGSAALHRTLEQASRLGLERVSWMSATSLREGPLTLQEVGDAFAQAR